jgi:hypothetical protein
MPSTWEIRDGILFVTVVGEWGNRGPAVAIAEAVADPQFQAGTALLLDVQLSENNPTAEQIRSRAEWIGSLRSKGLSSRCAVVVGPKSYQLGLARMAGTYLDFHGMSLGVFRSLEEAVHWLSMTSFAENAGGGHAG